MTITYNWAISQLDVQPTHDEFENVVVTAYWECTGTDGTYSGRVYSTCSFTPPESEGEFTPYESLTLDVVLDWIWQNGVDKDATEAAIQTQIDNQINPPIIHPPLPWSQS